jgi:hypothetical protein
MSGFCEGRMNNCDCRQCNSENEIIKDIQKAKGTHIFAFTKLPLGAIYHCAHCSETSYAYFVIDKPNETVYLCATHFGSELYRTMRAYRIDTIDGYMPNPPV